MKTWTPEEQKQHRRQWVDALRSGEYRQCRSDLSNEGGFCCLGVACEISGLGVWRGTAYAIEGVPTVCFLPSDVREWLGLRTDRGCFYENDRTEALYSLNDTMRKSFSEIADVIEREPTGLLATSVAA